MSLHKDQIGNKYTHLKMMATCLWFNTSVHLSIITV